MLYSSRNYIIPPWFGHKINSSKRLFILKKKALRLLFFLIRDAHNSYLFKVSNIISFIIRLRSRTASRSIIASSKNFHNLNSWFVLFSDTLTHKKRWSFLGCLMVLSPRNKFFEKNFVNVYAIFSRNNLQNFHKINYFIN